MLCICKIKEVTNNIDVSLFLILKQVHNIVKIGDNMWQHKLEKSSYSDNSNKGTNFKSSVLKYSSSGLICELWVYSIAAVKGLIDSSHLHTRLKELKIISLKSIISIIFHVLIASSYWKRWTTCMNPFCFNTFCLSHLLWF